MSPASSAHGRVRREPAPDEYRGVLWSMTGWTPRKLEILSRLSAGETQGEIADALDRSEETVRSHVKQMIRYMDVRSSVHLVGEAYRRGVLVLPAVRRSA